MRLRLPSPFVIARRQILCVAIASLVGGIFWANNQPINLATVLLYSILIGNLLIPTLKALHPIYWKRQFPLNWILFLAVVGILLVPIYVVSTVIVWWIAPPSPQQLGHLILTGWKFPVLVTFVVAVTTHLYDISRDRLERRNKELLRSVETGVKQLEQQEHELERAREIQQSLLPKKIPQLAGFEVAGAWQPASTVSGDYYDAFKLDDHRLGVCIADVVGKGVSAALMMANVQAAVRAFAGSAESPAHLCAKVNSLLCENLATGKFVTFLYGVLDSEARTLAYCNAGHINPILVSRDEVRSLDSSGAVLGVFPAWQYEDATVELRSGDRLLLVTDGITEASDGDDREFGEEKLAAAAQELKSRSAAEMNRALLDEVSAFCEARFRDDATLVVIAAQ
ncbi:MAG TPA: PP2C family protein-serine/threonine phosphatase [Terracidiphilus sp.]|jgi:sigma-B regulation protein RsbU (phosphoserine phosphatase)